MLIKVDVLVILSSNLFTLEFSFRYSILVTTLFSTTTINFFKSIGTVFNLSTSKSFARNYLNHLVHLLANYT